jgi:hypothetical protein
MEFARIVERNTVKSNSLFPGANFNFTGWI